MKSRQVPLGAGPTLLHFMPSGGTVEMSPDPVAGFEGPAGTEEARHGDPAR